MKIQVISTFLSIAALAVSARADVFVLKDGTELVGEILREEGDSYVLEVQITKSIKDEKVVAKADVAKIITQSPAQGAFDEIASLVPTPDMLSKEGYEQRIRVVEIFISQYPNLSSTEKAKEMLATLKSEAAQIAAGGLKFGGKMISPEEYKADAYELDARVLEAKVRDLGAKGEFPGALKAYSQLQTDYDGSGAYAEVSPFARKIIEAYRTQITRTLDTYDARVAERKAGLARMSGQDRANTERAIAEQDQAALKRYQAEKADKSVIWVTPDPFNKAALQDIQRTADQELTKIDRKERAPKMEGGELYRKAWQAIHQENPDPKAVKAAVSLARAARIPAKYVEFLEGAAKEANIPL